MRPVEFVGRQFGLLSVISRAANHGRRTMWLCRCACGGIKEIQTDSLSSGKTLSCGCYQLAVRRRLKGTLEERFWAKVERRGIDECWPWKATRRNGYGRLSAARSGGLQGAHRIAWSLANGEIPAGLKILHHCDNPPCCNPQHLFLGTQADNVHDMFRKGRGRIPVRWPAEAKG
jgi:hypothetical protein